MSFLNQALSQFAGADLAGLAGRVGLTPAQVEAGVAALHQSAPEPGDTAGLAADKTGLPIGALQQLLSHLGGEGGLAQIAGALGQGGGSGGGLGGGLGGLGGLAAELFNKD